MINRKFPNTKADVTLIFKKGNNNEKENQIPVIMFLTFSKVYENLLFEQNNDHMQNKF